MDRESKTSGARAEEQIRRQAAIIDNSDMGVIVYKLEDPNDAKSLRLQSLNRAAEEILRRKASDVVGKLVLEALPGSARESVERNARVARSGVPEHAPDVFYAGRFAAAGEALQRRLRPAGRQYDGGPVPRHYGAQAG